MTVELAVLGASVSGSLSPLLHQSAARALGHDLVYEAESCADESTFVAAVEARRARGARGLNVTAPYKRRAYELSEIRGSEAEGIGAVNTLCFEPDGRIRGENTDGPGLESLLARLPREALARVTILGGGGVARAARWALLRHGVGDLIMLVRDPARMSDGDVEGVRMAPLVPGAARPGLVIAALPPIPDATVRALAALPPPSHAGAVLDLAYGGIGHETELVRQARALGHVAYDGRSLLVAQAARSYRIWMGGELSAIESAMRDALKKHDPVSPLL